MALSEIGEYVECYQRQEKENLKQIAFVQYQIAEKIIAGLNLGKPEHKKFDTLFPSLSEEKAQQHKPKNIQERETWLTFLGRPDLI